MVELRAWTITKPEFDGFLLRSTRTGRKFRWLSAGCAVLGVACVAAKFVLPAPYSMIGIAWGVPLLIGAGMFLKVARRMRPDRQRALAEIWDTQGCVCPWCAVRVDESPCAKHGISTKDQPLLVAYWEAAATQRLSELGRCSCELLERNRAGTWMRLVMRWSSMTLDSADPSTSLRTRLKAAAIRTALFAPLFLGVFAFLAGGLRHSIPLEYAVIIPITVFISNIIPKGPRRSALHCKACSQLCAEPPPPVCPECGASLTKPDSLSRMHESRRGLGFIAIIVLGFGVALGIGFGLPRALALLPIRLQTSIYSGPIKPPFDFFDNALKTPISREDATAAADLLLVIAAPGGPRPVFDWDFIGKSLQSGALPSEYLERAARATVTAELSVDQRTGELVATVKPAFGALILGVQETPRLVFGGISVDGGPWTKGADWSLFLHDVDPFWRANGQSPALAESQLTFSTRIEGVALGTHTVRARCWIVVWGPPWQRYVPAFDANGVVFPPTGALGVYPLDLEAAITVD